MHSLQTLQGIQPSKINRNRGALIMDEELEEWLENDWFTSGETSWEEYYNDDDNDDE